MKNNTYLFIHVLLVLVCLDVEAETWAIKPVTVERPSELSQNQLEEFNMLINGLNHVLIHYEPPVYIPFDDRIRQFRSTGKRNENFDADIDFNHYGILDYPGSAKVSKTSLIKGAVDLRLEPNGDLLKVSIERNTLVYVAREYNDWAFVGVDIDQTANDNVLKDVVTGWVSKKYIGPAPKAVYDNNFRKLAENKSKNHIKESLITWLGQKKEDEAKRLALVKADAIRAELKRDNPSCPIDFTDVEMEGLITEDIDPYGDARHQLFLRCNKTNDQNNKKKISDIQLIKPTCNCLKIDQGEISNFEMKKESANFKISVSEPKEDCVLGRKFVICSVAGPCYKSEGECSLNIYTDLACPQTCLKWKDK